MLVGRSPTPARCPYRRWLGAVRRPGHESRKECRRCPRGAGRFASAIAAGRPEWEASVLREPQERATLRRNLRTQSLFPRWTALWRQPICVLEVFFWPAFYVL